MLEDEVFIFQTGSKGEQVPRGGKELSHLVKVPAVEDIVESINDNDFHSERVSGFWAIVFQLSDDLAVTTFLRVQNMPEAKAQHYLDQYMAAGTNDDVKTDIIVDILYSDNSSPDQTDPDPSEKASSTQPPSQEQPE